jgi:hypothetical protein
MAALKIFLIQFTDIVEKLLQRIFLAGVDG